MPKAIEQDLSMRIGVATVPYCKHRQCWVAIGGRAITDARAAQDYARNINKIIQTATKQKS